MCVSIVIFVAGSCWYKKSPVRSNVMRDVVVVVWVGVDIEAEPNNCGKLFENVKYRHGFGQTLFQSRPKTAKKRV